MNECQSSKHSFIMNEKISAGLKKPALLSLSIYILTDLMGFD